MALEKQIPIRLLGIETSCDETAAAVVENGRKQLSSVVSSQIDLHSKFGGVFPELASRQHIRTIQPVISAALSLSHLDLDNIDAIAVTRGPGLPGSLVVGLNTAKGIAFAKDLPLIGINHLEAHIYSAWVYPADVQQPPEEPSFPLLTLLVSGGHTELVLVKDHLSYHRLGGTLDDAAGESFDKVARLLGLPYPGGPSIQNAAVEGNPQAYSFPRARLGNSWDFSFSGLKTAVLRVVKKIEDEGSKIPVADIAASFQAVVVEILFEKTMRAASEFQAAGVVVAGGVSANRALRTAFLEQIDFKVYIPSLALCTDNASMVASAGYYRYIKQLFDPLEIDALPTWSVSTLNSL